MDTYCPKELSFIARMFLRLKPQEAKEYISIYRGQKVFELNQSKIAGLYDAFKIQNQDKKTEINNRRLFISAMLHIYSPHVFNLPDYIIMPYGFVEIISKAINKPKSYVSVTIREVITMERIYDDFRERVVLLVEQLKAVA